MVMGMSTATGTLAPVLELPGTRLPSLLPAAGSCPDPHPSSAPNPRRQNFTPGWRGGSAGAPPSPNASSPGEDRGEKRGESNSSWRQQAGSLPEAPDRNAAAFGEPLLHFRDLPTPQWRGQVCCCGDGSWGGGTQQLTPSSVVATELQPPGWGGGWVGFFFYKFELRPWEPRRQQWRAGAGASQSHASHSAPSRTPAPRRCSAPHPGASACRGAGLQDRRGQWGQGQRQGAATYGLRLAQRGPFWRVLLGSFQAHRCLSSHLQSPHKGYRHPGGWEMQGCCTLSPGHRCGCCPQGDAWGQCSAPGVPRLGCCNIWGAWGQAGTGWGRYAGAQGRDIMREQEDAGGANHQPHEPQDRLCGKCR